jgi:hypothetical protein
LISRIHGAQFHPNNYASDQRLVQLSPICFFFLAQHFDHELALEQLRNTWEDGFAILLFRDQGLHPRTHGGLGIRVRSRGEFFGIVDVRLDPIP